MDVHRTSLNRSEWTAFDDLCSQLLPSDAARSRRLLFPDWLITPVQRITRYPMILGQMQKFLPEQMTEALEVMKGTAKEVDYARHLRELQVITQKISARLKCTPQVIDVREIGD